MENFTYALPTEIVFGKDQIKKLPELLKNQGTKRMLLVYGRKSIKTMGIYDEIVEAAQSLGIELYEEGGVKPNPDLKSVLSGQKTIQEKGIDFILAAGGGSVVDCAKAIAFSHELKKEDVWNVFMKRAAFKTALPVGVILTLAGTGTETNGNTVISNAEEDDKRSTASPLLRPVFSIIDPTYTMNVSTHHTVAGGIDIMMHVFEQYFSVTPRTETSDYLSFGIIKSVRENLNRILSGEDSYETRANISWAATIALSWLLQQGKQGDWASHRLSYPITVDYDITHGFALSIIQPAWMEIALKHNPETMSKRLSMLGEALFNVTEPAKVIGVIRDMFRHFGAPVRFSDEDVDLTDNDIDRMVKNIMALGPVGHMIKVDEEKAASIFAAAR